MLNLCRLMVTCNNEITATVVVTEEWLGLLGSPDLGPRIRFETIPNVIPSEHGRAGDMGSFLDAVYTKMTDPFERLLDRLPPPAPTAIVADLMLRWAVEVSERRGVPVCVLCPLNATTFALRYNFHRLPSVVARANGGTDPSLLIENYIPGLKSIRLSDLGDRLTNEKRLTRILDTFASLRRRAHCVIFSSFHELEGDAIDLLRVLCHPSVGGFFTHCGMNSTLEAVYAGVPMLTLPITSDQPVNSRLVVEVWKIGYGLKEKANADGLIGREEITTAVARLMSLDTAEAVEMRRRAKLLKDAARATVVEGGSSWSDLTSFISFISTRSLCVRSS
nr:unnamed protein product [Digitaria exilis]